MKRIVLELGVLAIACVGAAGAGYVYRGNVLDRAPVDAPPPMVGQDAGPTVTYDGIKDVRDSATTYYLIPDPKSKEGYRMGTRGDSASYRAAMLADLSRSTVSDAIGIAGPGPDVSRLQGGINPRTGPDRMIRILAAANDSYMQRALDTTRTTLDRTPAGNVDALNDALRDAGIACEMHAKETRKMTTWANSFSRDPAVSGYTKGLTDSEYLYCVEEAAKRGLILPSVVPDNL
ncbi:hypothetical protein [Burkholderia cepacia]|uniref:hypothetical protein n=1 Tax=Burkholderia cepacia TaxID=292 RepID=UPI00075466C8|nr:hypothetical protein [Burkholderia cepacia]